MIPHINGSTAAEIFNREVGLALKLVTRLDQREKNKQAALLQRSRWIPKRMRGHHARNGGSHVCG